MENSPELERLTKALNELRAEGKVLLAYLFGSYARGEQHERSDIDLAVYLNAEDNGEFIDLTDRILMASDKPVEVLRLDDEDESPFIVQAALKGKPLVEPHMDTLYEVAHRALHESERIRNRRAFRQ